MNKLLNYFFRKSKTRRYFDKNFGLFTSENEEDCWETNIQINGNSLYVWVIGNHERPNEKRLEFLQDVKNNFFHYYNLAIRFIEKEVPDFPTTNMQVEGLDLGCMHDLEAKDFQILFIHKELSGSWRVLIENGTPTVFGVEGR